MPRHAVRRRAWDQSSAVPPIGCRARILALCDGLLTIGGERGGLILSGIDSGPVGCCLRRFRGGQPRAASSLSAAVGSVPMNRLLALSFASLVLLAAVV